MNRIVSVCLSACLSVCLTAIVVYSLRFASHFRPYAHARTHTLAHACCTVPYCYSATAATRLFRYSPSSSSSSSSYCEMRVHTHTQLTYCRPPDSLVNCDEYLKENEINQLHARTHSRRRSRWRRASTLEIRLQSIPIASFLSSFLPSLLEYINK